MIRRLTDGETMETPRPPIYTARPQISDRRPLLGLVPYTHPAHYSTRRLTLDTRTQGGLRVGDVLVPITVFPLSFRLFFAHHYFRRRGAGAEASHLNAVRRRRSGDGGIIKGGKDNLGTDLIGQGEHALGTWSLC